MSEHDDYIPKYPWEIIERKDKIIEQQAAEIEALRSFAESSFILSVYNRGYHAGHNATVEGGYTHIYAQDMGTCHDDILDEIIDGLTGGEE